MHKGPGDGHALLLSPGELRGEGVLAIFETHASENLAHATNALRRGTPATKSGRHAFSHALKAGSKLYCWNTNPRLRARKSTRSSGAIVVRSFSRTCSDPSEGLSRPARIEISVVLPQPDGPTSSVIAPGMISRSIPRSACRGYRRFQRFSPGPGNE